VIAQVENPMVELDDPMHDSIRWRLLFPVVGHLLRLPPALVLAFAPAGCVLLLALLVAGARARGVPWNECALLAIVVGGESWFFTSTGWLGYFDSWLVLGLLAIAFARSRAIVWVACLLTPWIDERILPGFPLAILVRWIDAREERRAGELTRRFFDELAVPALLLAAYPVLRLFLAGHAGALELAALHGRVATFRLPVSRVLFGCWEGLRFGWLLVVAAILALWGRGQRGVALFLGLAVAAMTLVALGSSNDLSRAMMLLVPVLPLGWQLGRSMQGWVRWRIVGPALALATLVVPAHHVVTDFTMPVNSLWFEWRFAATVQRELGGATGREPR